MVSMFIFYSIHHPRPGQEAALAESMARYGALMGAQPGIVFVAPSPFKDPEKGTLMGISIWESEAAFQAALPILEQARKDAPPRDLESRPPEVHLLHSAR